MISNARAESDALHASRADKGSAEFDKTGSSTPVSDGEGSYERKRSGHAKRGSI